MRGMRTHRHFEHSPAGSIAMVSGGIAIQKHAVIGF